MVEKGCEAHRNLIERIFNSILKRGLGAKTEKRIILANGDSRYVDVAGLSGLVVVELHQVGVQTQAGIPVKRERDAIKDIEEATGITVEFHAYNQTENL